MKSETLMVIATVATAVAALWALVAAVRQEDATFTSQLYNKEIDAVSAAIILSDRITLTREVVQTRISGIIPSKASIQPSELSRMIDPARDIIRDWGASIATLHVVLPIETEPYIDALDLFGVNRFLGIYALDHANEAGWISSWTDLRHYIFGAPTVISEGIDVAKIFQECASNSLRRGRPIDGQAFAACADTHLPPTLLSEIKNPTARNAISVRAREFVYRLPDNPEQHEDKLPTAR